MPAKSLKPALTHDQRSRRVLWVLGATLILNWLVAGLKIIFGMATQCMVIVADGFHSFADGASNIIGLIAVSIAKHPADHNHPYGHQKYETLASTMIAVLLFFVSFGIFQKAWQGLRHPVSPEVNALSFIVMSVTFAVNLLVAWGERRMGKSLKSEVLINDSWHTFSDVFVTLTVFAALIGIGMNIPHLDAIFSLLIGGVIVAVAFRILKRSSDILVDRAVLDPKAVEKVVRGVDGVIDCHEIRTRGQKEAVYVDLHVLVDSQMTVLASHGLANIIEHNLRQAIPVIIDVVVHIEPVSHGHEEL